MWNSAQTATGYDTTMVPLELMAEAEELRKMWQAALDEYATARQEGRPSSTPRRRNSNAPISVRQRRQSTRALLSTRRSKLGLPHKHLARVGSRRAESG